MFVGLVRKNSFYKDLSEFEENQICDRNLILNSTFYNQNLCFGAYENEKLMGLISACVFQESILINNFYYKKELCLEVKKRLIAILLANINQNKKSILFLATYAEERLFKEFKFKSLAPFTKAKHLKNSDEFNIDKAVKSIKHINFERVLKKVDLKAFNENRFNYITKSIFKSSSLILSTNLGYQHSYALNKKLIKLSPWIMDDLCEDEANILIQSVLYHRGIKEIIAFIPTEVKKIVNLYKTYGFKMQEDYKLIYLNTRPSIKLDMIYGF